MSRKCEKLVIGSISYGERKKAINRFARFSQYLSEKTGAVVQLDPVFNEDMALTRIKSHDWSLVFAPSGLAAIAIDQNQYIPLFPLHDLNNSHSILVVREDSPINVLEELEGQSVAFGQPGSATGYYLPIYNLYGLTLAKILFTPTPKTVLEFVAQGKASAGALSREEFDSYRSEVSQTGFRVIYADLHNVPHGVVLMDPYMKSECHEQIRQVMSGVSSEVARETGYVPNGPRPDYQYMISVVKRVRSIFPHEFEHRAGHLELKPARLFRGRMSPTKDGMNSIKGH